MAVEERVECPNCRRAVIPRLWLTGGDFLTYKTTQHLCQYCGVVMYETGGTYKRGPTIIAAVFVCLVLLATVLAVGWIYLGR
jgi:hypothetical protein